MEVHNSHIVIKASDYKTQAQRAELFQALKIEIKNIEMRTAWPQPSTDEMIFNALSRGFNSNADEFIIMAMPLGTSTPLK